MAENRLLVLENLGALRAEDEEEELASLLGEERPDFSTGHYENLAKKMDEKELKQLAQDVMDWYRDDEESNREWMWRLKIGIRLLGVSRNKSLYTVESGDDYWINTDNDEIYEYKDRPFERATSVVHPILMEAVNQFYARSVSELWPEDGPVQTQVMGQKTEERAAQAERVKGFMNYQYNTLMPDGYETHAGVLFRLGFAGSMFKKVYYDPELDIVDTCLVEAQDFIVPYTATSLRKAQRYTQVIRMVESELEDEMEAGMYREIDLAVPGEEETQTKKDVHREVDQVDGRQPSFQREDGRYTLFEMHVNLSLKVDGGELRPYIVTVLSDQTETLSIRRNWRENDKKYRKRLHFIHYYFLPGLGFYGFGFLHILGDLAMATTGALRSLLDAASFANMQGGFHSEDVRMDDSDMALGPGEWRGVRTSLEKLGDAFFSLPYKEPSSTLFQLLGHMEDLGRRLANTTELMVGDVNKNIPVGTVLALIEQGQRVFSAIHKGNQRSMREEFSLVAELNHDHLPKRYPYLLPNADQEVFRDDFDERVDILPVADPNVVTATERIAQAEAVLQQADKYPQLYDLREANRRMLMALRISGIDKLLPAPGEIPARDPVSENVALLMSDPIRVYPTDDHQAHMMVHEAFFAELQEADQKRLQNVYMSHMSEHQAHQYVLEMEAQIGMAIPIPGLNQPPAEEVEEEPVPPEIIEEVTRLTAQAVATQERPPTPEEQAAMAQQEAQAQATQQQAAAQSQIEAERMQREQVRKDAQAEADITRKDALAQAQIERDNTKTAADLNREMAAEEARLIKEFVSEEAEQAVTGPTQPQPPFGGAV